MGGFFGTISNKPCATDLFYGTDYNSHLGTHRGGMCTLHDGLFKRSIHNLSNSYFRTKFEKELSKFTGNSGIGVISDTDPQPIFMNSHLGKYAVVTVAKVNNIKEIEQDLIRKGRHFSELSSGRTNQTELISLLISEGKSFEEGIENVFNNIDGSCSMLILTEDGIIAARDKWGRTPIMIGKKDGAHALSSETSCFPNLDYEMEYNVGAGEIVQVTADSITQLRKPNKEMEVCSFLWVYYGYPASEYEGVNVEEARAESGRAMARRDDVEADFVSAIPDSGIGMALGYAQGKQIPYQRAIVKYTPTWPRSFTPENQTMRELVAKMKLIPNKSLLKNKRIVFCDDSIVRGTQLRDNVSMLYDYGAKEVHMRIASPPILYSCPFLNFSSSHSVLELIARRVIKDLEGDENKDVDLYSTSNSEQYNSMIEEIRQRLNITSLKFNTIEDLIKTIGIEPKRICTYCYNGKSCTKKND